MFRIPDGLYGRAAAVLGTTPDGICWPDGLSPPHHTERRADPAQFERRLAEQTARQELLVAWAERYGLTQSPIGCCPPWLLRPRSRMCRPHDRLAVSCTRYGTEDDYDWLEHAIGWLKDGTPAAITSAPDSLQYFLNGPPWRLAYWAAQDKRVRVTSGDGWHGGFTAQIVMWRADLLADVRAVGQDAN